jgi:hypothetical protein
MCDFILAPMVERGMADRRWAGGTTCPTKLD